MFANNLVVGVEDVTDSTAQAALDELEQVPCEIKEAAVVLEMKGTNILV